MNKENRSYQIETALDRCQDWDEFVELLAEICREKSFHVASTWGDQQLAEEWQRRGVAVNKLSR